MAHLQLISKRQSLLAQHENKISDLSDDICTIKEEVTTQAFRSSIDLHLSTVASLRLVSNCASILSGMPHLISYARFRKTLLEFESVFPGWASDCLRLLRGELDPSDSPLLFDMPMPIRRFLDQKHVRVIASSIADIERCMIEDSTTKTVCKVETIRVPVSGSPALVLYVEGVFFAEINPADFEDCIRMKYSQSISHPYSTIAKLEDLAFPLMFVPGLEKGLLFEARNAVYE